MFTQHLTNIAYTTNGAVSNKSSLSAVLDLYSMGITAPKQDQLNLVKAAFNEDPYYALKAALYARDVRQGQGNRDLFRVSMNYLLGTEPAIVNFLLPYIPEIGRWKDVYELVGKNPVIDGTIYNLVNKALFTDNDALCAKWFPRQSQFHKDFAKTFNYSLGDVRRHVAKLTKVVETQMCNKQWHTIEYSHVPSIANIKYNRAFLKNDQSRREEFLNRALTGEVKVNTTVSYPHDIANIVFKYRGNYSNRKEILGANALWSQLPNYMEDNHFNILPIIDTSSSMFSPANGTTSQCISIAVGLGIYITERNVGDYKNLWMNFSTTPKAYYLKGNTLSEKIQSLDYNNWSGSTNLDAAMGMILQAAQRSPETVPKAIIIVSDMEFDSYWGPCVKFTNYEKFKSDFKAIGLEMPTTIFWRVNTSNIQQPVLYDDKKVLLINGYSPTILKEVLNGNILEYTPLKAMKAILDPKYTFIDNALKNI